jgi:hypothetical protein
MRRDEVDAPPSVFALVETMMSLDPQRRYQTPSQLLEAIRAARREVEGGGANGGGNHRAAVEALVEAGADVTIPDRYGITALQHARTRGYSQIARILENAGAH